MTDWSTFMGRQGTRGILAPGGSTPLGTMLTLSALGFSVTTGAWTANRAVYMPVVVEEGVTVTDMAINVVTQAGNVNLGIYTFDNDLVVSTGATAVGAAGIQIITITDTLLTPGWYKIAFACDSGTAVFRNSTLAAGNARACGVQEQTGLSAGPALPNPAVPIAYATAVMPLVVASYSATF